MGELATKADLQEFYNRIFPYLNRADTFANADYLAKIGESDGKATYNGEWLAVPTTKVFDKANDYSTNEQVIGRWTNGYPLYQRSYEFTTPTTANSEKAVISSLPGVIVDCKIRSYFRSSNTEYGYLFGNWFDGNSKSMVYVYQNKLMCYVGSDTSMLGRTLYITIQYYKGNESASAFNYADENDYSTTEKIVGTWLDGSNLYQKTIDIGTMPNATTKNVAHGISNLKHIVELKGYAYNSTQQFPLPYVDSASDNTYKAAVYRDSDNLIIVTFRDWSSFSGYITVKYTKTS